MKVSLDWIKEFVSLPQDISPKDFASKFTLATAEVEDVLSTGEYWQKIHVVEVLRIEPHPEADNLRLVTFALGGDKTFKVVCGAQNVKVGMKTAYAPTGTLLPNGLLLGPKKIRGVMSEGMLCSEEELGMADSSEGIIELPSDAPVGTSLKDYWKKNSDIVLDIDNKSLTHRPDLWGHYGMAREVAAIYRLPLKNPFDEKWMSELKKGAQGSSPITVKVESDSAALAYFGLSIDGIKVEKSPDWMRMRLESAGLRSINSIVDISNYVMLELGIPNHIFDRDQIKGGKVHIKSLNSSESFVTLDEIERALVPGDTVIADSEKTLVLAGIMGGQNSGVSDKTRNIFIEVANWKAAPIRRTSVRLGLRTDSSQRYEKSLDSKLCERTLWRIVELVKQLNPEAKINGSVSYDGQNLSDIPEMNIGISCKKIRQTLGRDIENAEIIDILNRLDFKVSAQGDELSILVPSYRSTKDIECDSDIIEEVGRIIGYDNIKPISPLVGVAPVRLSAKQKLHRKIRDFLVLEAGNFELQTYPLAGEALYKKSSWVAQNSNLVLQNPVSVDHDRMRDSLIPSMLDVMANNSKHVDKGRVFEIGRRYAEDQKEFSKDLSQLCVAYYSKDSNPFQDLVNDSERLFDFINLSYDLMGPQQLNAKFPNPLFQSDWIGVHPFERFDIRVMGKIHGVIMSIHPLLLKKLKIKGNLALMVLDLWSFEERELKEKIKYSPLAKFPGSDFDYTLALDQHDEVGKIFDSLKKLKIAELKKSGIRDIFERDHQKFVTIRSHFADDNKTLTGEFLAEAQKSLLEHLSKDGFVLKT
ncbi:MAG: phenylalanine--tRNA ligase subunit beta [Bdellovibrio sp.]